MLADGTDGLMVLSKRGERVSLVQHGVLPGWTTLDLAGGPAIQTRQELEGGHLICGLTGGDAVDGGLEAGSDVLSGALDGESGDEQLHGETHEGGIVAAENDAREIGDIRRAGLDHAAFDGL